MAESFVLRYPVPGASADEAEWLAVDASGARIGEPERGTLAAAAAAVGGRRLIVLVPGEDVALSAPELPARGAAKLLKLAPFALEEQLAADVETLHFAIGRQGSDRRVPVATVEREQLAGWLAQLALAGLSPAALYPDSLLVPDNPGHVVVLIDAGRVIVKRPGALPLVLDADPLNTALALAGLEPSADAAVRAQHLLVYASTADWRTRRPVIEALRDSVGSLNVQLLPHGPLPLLAASAVTAAPWSLLQAEFAVRGQGFAGEWPRWRMAASLLAAFLALHVVTLGVNYWRVHREEVTVDQQLHAAAAEALPNIQNIGRLPSVRLAVESRLRASRAAVSEGLLGTLGALAAATSAAPGTLIESLSYRDGTTDLTVDAPDVGALDRLREAAKGRGFDAQLQGAAQHASRYQGRLQLKGPRS
ncbi:MAG TPA: type II secretion system protein GspL [Steroidobacteraceae bacterium]|nr:type II secretion system protein GspL [Steroidobacteraceae bacterium]